MTTFFQDVGGTPTDVIAELSLEADESYSMQNISAQTPVRYLVAPSNSNADPDDPQVIPSTQSHILPPHGFIRVTVEADSGLFMWAPGLGAKLAITFA